MIRREFMKLLSIATAGLALFRVAGPSQTRAAKPPALSQRAWLTGSARSGCAHLPGYNLPLQ